MNAKPAIEYLADIAKQSPELAEVAARALAMVIGYVRQRDRDDQLSSVSVENPFYELDIINPETGRTKRTGQIHTGKISGIVEGEFQSIRGRFILKRATTDQDISTGSDYWKRCALNHELDELALAFFQITGFQIDGIIFEALRVPAIRPRKLTVAEVSEIAESGIYFGQRVSDDQKQACELLSGAKSRLKEEKAAAKKKDASEEQKAAPAKTEALINNLSGIEEDANLYHARCLSEVTGNPERYFGRKLVVRTESDVIRYAEELWHLAGEVHRGGTIETSPRNPAACFNRNRTCQFIEVCAGDDSIDSQNWIHVDAEPSRLTQKKLSDFQACRRLHYLKNVLGLESSRASKSEKLHLAMMVQRAIERIER